MSIPGSASPLFFQTAAAAGSAAVEGPTRSLRFNEADSAYLSRTPSSAGNRKTWTWSCWFKRGKNSNYSQLFNASTAVNNYTQIYVESDNTFVIANNTSAGGNRYLVSTQLLRDPSAWYHLVAVFETDNPTQADRMRLYVNGERVTDFSATSLIGSGTESNLNSTNQHSIGSVQPLGTNGRLDGYLADVYFVDGAALEPTSFAGYDSNGVWQAKNFSGSVNHDPSYGLSSSDIVSSTGFQSNEGGDKVIDSIDPSANRAHTVAGNAGETLTVTFSPAVTVNTSLEIYAYLTVSGDSEERRARVNGGSWFNPTSTADTYHDLGFTGSLSTIQIQYNGSTNSRSMTMRGIRIDGNFVHTGTAGVNGFHLKFDDNSSNAALGTDSGGSSNTFTVHNIQANNTGNSGGFQAVTWTGNGGTQAITTTGMSPDLVWIKSRSNVEHHSWNDSVRGANKQLESSRNIAETTHSNILTSFGSTGFTLSSSDAVNKSGATYVGWCWKAGGTASSNTDGTITSSVSASTEYGFSVVTFTGPGSAGFASVGHGLGQKPKFIICKDRDNNRNWSVFHEDVVTSDTDILSLNQDIATFTSGTAAWDVSAINSSTFTPYFRDDFGASFGADNVAYCWAEKSGFSKFGTYTGNGNTSGSGPRVELGFKPAFLMVKGFNVQSGWRIFDATRDPGGQFQKRLYANESGTESTNSTQYVDYDDTGFDVEASGSLSTYNVNGKTYIYMAFAKDPGGEVVDSLLDVPTNGTQTDTGAGGEVSGNYCTINPLSIPSQSVTVSNGNLDHTGAGTNVARVGTIAIPSSGKWYWEITCKSGGSGAWLLGINGDTMSQALRLLYVSDARKYTDAGGGFSSYGASFTTGDVIGVAVDMDADTLTFYKNGSTQGTAFTSKSSGYTNIFPYFQTEQSGRGLSVNFGQRAWVYSAPSNHKALCTTNLPTPTIADGSDYFETVLYSGNQTAKSITTGHASDFVWLKVRNQGNNHFLFDSVRGVGRRLMTSGNNDEDGDSSTDTVTSFDSTGFSIGADTATGGVNANSAQMVAYSWVAASSTATNTDGSITSSVRANQTAGFSIVGWSSSSSVSTVGHGLNTPPYFIMTKNRSVSNAWWSYHFNLGNTKAIRMDTTDAAATMSSTWNNTSPTNSVFTVGGEFGNGNDMIAYCFAPVSGYCAIGGYQGNSGQNFQYTGFQPRWIMIKTTSITAYPAYTGWAIFDTERPPAYNVNVNSLFANNTNQEGKRGNNSTASAPDFGIDILSNGFCLRDNGASEINLNNEDYIYLAFANNPFQANGGLAR